MILATSYSVGAELDVHRHGSGLINDTFVVSAAKGSYVLQRVHPVFSPRIHHDIRAVTRHLASRGVQTPSLIDTQSGAPWTEHDGSVWRLMTRMRGVSFDAVGEVCQVEAAAEALGRFHGALADLDHVFVGGRSGVHDTVAHLERLEGALTVHREHRLYDDVALLAEAILAAAPRLPPLVGLPERIVHGDPKFNNVLFEATQGPLAAQAVGWIDLDTVGPMALPLELGDAWRSWCNTRGENDPVAGFRLDIYEASLRGYARALPFALPSDEREALLHGVEWITLELSARFAADALAESYFGWDSKAFAGRGEHNLARAQSQWSLHEQVMAVRRERSDALTRALDE